MRVILFLACAVLLLAMSWSYQQKVGVSSDRRPPVPNQAQTHPQPASGPAEQWVATPRPAARDGISHPAGNTPESYPQGAATVETLGGAHAWESEQPPVDLAREQSEKERLLQAGIDLASTNLQAAAEWVASLPPGETQREAVLAVGYEASREDPITALELGAQLAPSESRDQLLVHSIRQWASSAGPNARAWVEGIQNPALRQKLLAAITVVEAERDAAAAATHIAELPPGETQNRTAVLVIQEWAKQDPVAAKTWAENFPQGPARTGALEVLRQPETATNASPK